MDDQTILSKLPYSKPFLFVDALESISEEGVVGSYTFSKDSFFYQGHFKDLPVTPGVILTECCAQIGLVCLGIHLLEDVVLENVAIALSSSEMEYLRAVFPGEKVTVRSEKIYFRFQKLKCRVKMFDSKENLVCRGVISGMFKTTENGQ